MEFIAFGFMADEFADFLTEEIGEKFEVVSDEDIELPETDNDVLDSEIIKL